MATFVLVHGGGHGGWCYWKVKRILEGEGHTVFAPSLTGLAERSASLSPAVDLDSHINDIVQLLHYWDLDNAVVAGHSYGGMVITGVGDRAHGRVGKLVFLDAANPTNGQSLSELTGGGIDFTRQAGKVVNGVELVLLPAPGAAAFYGVTDPEDQAWMEERFTGHPWRCFEQKLELHNEEQLSAIPQYHIVCESTLIGRDQKLMEDARRENRLWIVDTGHDLMVTEPEFVAGALMEIAARP